MAPMMEIYISSGNLGALLARLGPFVKKLRATNGEKLYH
jgi:hypothetical protein